MNMKGSCGICSSLLDSEMPVDEHTSLLLKEKASEMGLQLDSIVEEEKKEQNKDHDGNETVPEEDDEDGEEEEQEQRNFDKDPTDLYLSLMRRDWSTAEQLSVTNTNETKIWIYRQEKDGKIRWKLLPLHAAIIFDAPASTVNALVHAYPKACTKQDDQGMVPLHLAVRMGSDTNVLNILLKENSYMVHATDRKGRTPIVLAEKINGPSKTTVMAALSAAAAATVNENKNNKNKSIPEVPIDWKLQAHLFEQQLKEKNIAYEALSKDYEHIQNEQSNLQAELQEAKDMAENAITTQHKCEKDNKAVISNLVSQIGNLQDKVTCLTNEKVQLEESYTKYETTTKDEIATLNVRIQELQRMAAREQASRQVVEKNLEDCQKQCEEHVAKIKTLEHEKDVINDKLKDTEKKLDDVMISEQEYAWKHQALATQLADIHGGGVVVDETKINQLELEKQELRDTVNKLSVKLYKVVGFLDEMVQEQEAIITETSNNTENNDEQNNNNNNTPKNNNNNTLMKEQIADVIDNIIENMPPPQLEQEEVLP